VSLTPLGLASGVVDTAVTLDLIFERLWLPLEGLSIEKTYIGKLSCNIPVKICEFFTHSNSKI
jgi:hypothetical protein